MYAVQCSPKHHLIPTAGLSWYFLFWMFRFFLLRLSRQLWNLVAEWKIKRDAGHEYTIIYWTLFPRSLANHTHYFIAWWQVHSIPLSSWQGFPSRVNCSTNRQLGHGWVTTHCWRRSPVLPLLNHSSTNERELQWDRSGVHPGLTATLFRWLVVIDKCCCTGSLDIAYLSIGNGITEKRKAGIEAASTTSAASSLSSLLCLTRRWNLLKCISSAIFEKERKHQR